MVSNRAAMPDALAGILVMLRLKMLSHNLWFHLSDPFIWYARHEVQNPEITN